MGFKTTKQMRAECKAARAAQARRGRERVARLAVWAELCGPWLLPSMRRAMAGEAGCWPAYPAQRV